MSDRAPRRLLALLIGTAAILTLSTAGWGELYNETDGQYGGAAKVMAQSGSWLIPENDGIPRLVKPPMLYWALALSMKIFGVNEFAARFPNALAVTAWVALTFLIGSRIGGTRRGFLAGVILLTSLGTFTLGRIIMPEPMFSAFIAAALYCAIRGIDHPPARRGWFLGFWFFSSLASFTKGWHGLFYPLAIVGVSALFCRPARQSLRHLVSWQGVALFGVVNLPWYLYLEYRFPGYVHNLVVVEQFGHLSGATTPATSYTDVPRWQFLSLQLVWLFPWSLGILAAAPQLVRHLPCRLRNKLSFSEFAVLSWMVIVLGSILVTGQRQDYYAMSMWPAFALTMAWALERARVHVLGLMLCASLAAGLVWLRFGPDISSATAPVADRATAWTTITNLDHGVWLTLRETALLAMGGGLLFALCGLFGASSRAKFAGMAAAAICLDLGAVSGTSLVSPYFSLARVAGDIHKDASVVYDGGIDTGSSLLFYSNSRVILLNQDPNKDFIVRKFGIGRDRYLNEAEFVAFWNSATPAAFITEESRLSEWEEQLGRPLTPVARCGTQVLLKNTP